MIKFIRNIPWKEILVIGLLAALGIGAVVGIGAALTAKTESVSAFKFERGAIDEDGLFIKSERSIYTKNYIECQGLEITPDFEATGTYQVFYYDTNKVLLGATPVMDARSSSPYKKGSDFHYAKYCRIVITPEVPVDEDGYVDEDWKINFYEVAGIAGKFTIKVNKQQKAVPNENLFDSSTIETGCSYSVVEGLASRTVISGTNAVTVTLDGHVNYIKLDYDVAPGTYSYLFVDRGNSVLSSGELNNETLSYNLIVPESAVLLVINYSADSVPAIYRAG